MQWIPIRSIENAFQWTGIDTKGMDIYALVAVGADMVLSVAPGRDRMVTAGSAG